MCNIGWKGWERMRLIICRSVGEREGIHIFEFTLALVIPSTDSAIAVFQGCRKQRTTKEEKKVLLALCRLKFINLFHLWIQ
jgi:hypothetical protein